MAKLMLVEDDNNLREIYEARLQAEGYTIVSAHDGEEALVVAKAEKPDLIIADVMMPKISGFEMLDILRNTEELKGVKVIMLTALGQSDDQQRASQLGADRYLVKSQVTLEDIVKTAHELLGDSGGAVAATAAPDPAPSPDSPTPPAPADPAPSDTPAADAPAPAPETPPAEAPANGDSPAQTSSQEEADIEAKIEDFVAGATDSTPAASPTATPEAQDTGPTISVPVNEPPASDDSTVAADDKLVSEAADALAASTPAPPDSAPETPESEVVVPTEPAEPSGLAEPEAPTPAATDNDNVSISGKKVIQPIDSAPKKDLDALLAEEEAKNQAGSLASAPPVVVNNETGTEPAPDSPPATPSSGTVNPTTPASNPVNTVSGPAVPSGTPGSTFDPNQIAL